MSLAIDRKRLVVYVWIGSAYLALWLLNAAFNHTDIFLQQAFNEIWRSIYLLAVNFLILEFVAERFSLSIKKITLFGILVIPAIFIFALGLFAWKSLGIVLHMYTKVKTFPTFGKELEEHCAAIVMSFLFYGIIRHLYDHTKLKQATQQLRIEKQEAELNYLKSQTNPHFLFNTLNNIYSLSRDKSDLAPESILRLSKILRFMLYEIGGAYIAIEQELKIIADYIELEKLRYDESLRINLTNDVEDMKQAIPPLLLIPLVENAFKHGVSETRGDPFINIYLSIKNRQLTFIVKNSTEAAGSEIRIKENIGLSNLRRQLELLYKDYKLSLEPKEFAFTATLKVNLSSHV